MESSLLSVGQLYGLEKFWAFLKYSRRKPKVNPKLEEILKNFKRLEDFRVEGASFPQQFYPTKSGIIVNESMTCQSFLQPFFSFVSRLYQHQKPLPPPRPKKQLQQQQQEEVTVIWQARQIHWKRVVNIFQRAIVVQHDPPIDGQLPNGVKTSFLFVFPFVYVCVCM